jgi:hypothetical protein
MSAIAGSDFSDAAEQSLARDMIDVHGAQAAAAVARDNARVAALAGQRQQARAWIRVLQIIQRGPASNGETPNPGSIRG